MSPADSDAKSAWRPSLVALAASRGAAPWRYHADLNVWLFGAVAGFAAYAPDPHRTAVVAATAFVFALAMRTVIGAVHRREIRRLLARGKDGGGA